MRKFHFLPAALLIGMAACNNAGDKPATTDTTATAPAKDTMAHMADAAQAGAPLPPVPAGAKVFLSRT